MSVFNSKTIQEFKEFRTPFYYYDMALLRRTLEVVRTEAEKRNYRVHYAFKANTNKEIIAEMLQYGFGADCVSGNEVKCALENGFSPDKIVFAGVGKTDTEIIYGLQNKIHCFNCESKEEAFVINEIAGNMGIKAPIALRINPDVNANTHHYITTGLEENKFGISQGEFDKVLHLVRKLKNLDLIGIHFHIGSQITDITVFKNLCNRVNQFVKKFENEGIELQHVNVGGGFGVDYRNPDENPIADFETYFSVFDEFLQLRPGVQLHFELGRSLVAPCGSLISKVIYVKEGIAKKFVILDAGMTDLLRPALYQAYHKIENITSIENDTERYDVVGPICETSDCFGKDVELKRTHRNDLVAIRTAGAYGEVMASSYNLRDKAGVMYSE